MVIVAHNALDVLQILHLGVDNRVTGVGDVFALFFSFKSGLFHEVDNVVVSPAAVQVQGYALVLQVVLGNGVLYGVVCAVAE